MNVRILKPVVVSGFPGVAVGDVIEVPDRVAGDLIAEGIAAPSAFAPEPVEVREPEVEKRDPAPPKKRSKSAPQ